MDHTPDDVQIDIPGLWKDLQRLIRDVVEQMNHDEELRRKTGGLDFQLGPADTIVVKKHALPALYLTLTQGTAVIAANYRIVINGPNVKEQEIRESLSFALDGSRTTLCRNNQGEFFTIEQAVFYLLRPFLHPEFALF